MLNRFTAIHFLIAINLVFISCLNDVPHENPLDPDNTERGVALNGTVQTFYEPLRPITNAVITLEPGEQKVFTNSNGRFQFGNLLPGEYIIYCSAEGHSQDSTQIMLDGNDETITFFLDGLPFFKNISLKTQHVSRFFPIDDMFYLQIEAEVDDLDGIADINTVYFDIPEFNTSDTLDATLNAGVFAKRLSIVDVPVNTIHTLIGRRFILSVTDDVGETVQSPAQFLTRVIELTPVVLSPISTETTVPADSITFKWERVLLPYWFSFTIEIYQINLGVLTKVSEVPNITSSETNFTIANNLPAGEYAWFLIITDEFGNTSSSKEGTFDVD